jgi:hypothetical protein
MLIFKKKKKRFVYTTGSKMKLNLSFYEQPIVSKISASFYEHLIVSEIARKNAWFYNHPYCVWNVMQSSMTVQPITCDRNASLFE